jgi:hypothetical protein
MLEKIGIFRGKSFEKSFFQKTLSAEKNVRKIGPRSSGGYVIVRKLFWLKRSFIKSVPGVAAGVSRPSRAHLGLEAGGERQPIRRIFAKLGRGRGLRADVVDKHLMSCYAEVNSNTLHSFHSYLYYKLLPLLPKVTNICNLHSLHTCNLLPIIPGRTIFCYHFDRKTLFDKIGSWCRLKWAYISKCDRWRQSLPSLCTKQT